MTNVCLFRLDDITPDMDWNKFYRVKAIFDKYKVKPLVGVVPDNGDPGLRRGEYHKDFWEYIASLEQVAGRLPSTAIGTYMKQNMPVCWG